MVFQTSRAFARALDRDDALSGFRERFFVDDPELLYVDGNSLGRLPLDTARRIEQVVREEWGERLVRGWNGGWYDAPARIGDKIGQLIGAADGQVVVSDSTSVDLFKLAASALRLRSERTKIVTDSLNFPSDLYVLQGLNRLLDDRWEIVSVGSDGDEIIPDLDSLQAAIDETTALVTLSHVVFKSGFLYDMAEITRRAHEAGALVVWDLSHSVGSVEIDLDGCDVDFAVGCTYKYLNGGPGSPAFLYVNRRLSGGATSPIWGWFGQNRPFDFSLNYSPAPGVTRFLAGTPSVLSLVAVESSVGILLEAGMGAIRRKSTALTSYFVQLSDAILSRAGFVLGSPRESEQRGGHVSLRHPEGYRINRALIEEMKVIPDFREPDNVRFGFSPLYTSFEDVWRTVDRIARVVDERRYSNYPKERPPVT